jgi:hypothetical protein
MKPETERRAGLFKNRSGQRVNMVPAMVASVSSAACNAIVFPFDSAFRAHGHAIRPTLLFHVLKASIIGWKIFVELIDCVSQVLWDCLSAVHGSIMPFVLLVVKVYINYLITLFSDSYRGV